MDLLTAVYQLPPVLLATISAVLVFGAAARLTRFVTVDSLGGWLIRDPASRWAVERERRHREAKREAIRRTLAERPLEAMTEPERRVIQQEIEAVEGEGSDDWLSWQGRLVSGLYCPHCVGFWITAAVTVPTFFVLLSAGPVLLGLWLLGLGVLTLAYLVSHLSAELDG